MQRKICSPVPETRYGDGGGHQLVCIRRRKHAGLYRESEGSIVSFEGTGQHNPVREKGPCFVHATEARRVMEIAEWLSTSYMSSERVKGSFTDRPNRRTEIRRAYSTHKSRVSEFVYACLLVKNIGKPCAGKPHARFDEGGLAKAAMVWLLRHRQTKGTGTDRPNLKRQQPALYSTDKVSLSNFF